MSARSENLKKEEDDASATKKELERLFPEESGPVDLYEGYPYELEVGLTVFVIPGRGYKLC